MTASSELNHANDLAVGPVQAQETLESLPRELKVVSLYLALISRRSSFNKLVEDVFLFMKDRYFIGEVLEACLEGKSWYSCTILQVREPTDEEIKKYNDCNVDSADCDQVLPPACLYHYQVQKFCNYNDINRVFEAKASQVRRKKRLITKGKLTLFLKQCLTLNSFGVWCVQETVQQDLGVDGVKFSDIFAGQPPHFPERYEKNSKKSKKVLSPTQESNVRNGIVVKKETAKKKSKHSPKLPTNCYPSNECSDVDDFKNNTRIVTDQGSLSSEKALQSKAKYLKKLVKQAKKKLDEKQHLGQYSKRKWRGLSWEERQKIKEKKKKRALMEKLKRREERVNAKAKRGEEKLEMSLRLKERNKIREDLECEDLKALPAPQEVKCSHLPNDLFGDFMVILEFLQSFDNLFRMKKMYPRAITFNTLENALVNNAIDSPMSSIVIFFLETIFEMQVTDNETMENDAFDYAVDELTGDAASAEAARLSSAQVASRLYKGAFFDDFILNYLSVTEVLRLHFLNSTRGKSELVNSRNEHDSFVAGDPVSILLNKHPQLLRDLSSMHICEMPIKEKIDVLNCLVDQFLSCTSVREKIEERAEELRQVQLEVKKATKEAQVKRNKVQALKDKERREAKMKVKGENTSDIILKTEGGELSEKELRSKRSEIEEKIVKIRQLAMSFNLQPLGKDRAHRRYWVFSSLPGLFVENNPFEIGPCLSTATPKLTNSPQRSPTMKSMKNPNHKNMPQKSPLKKESDIHASPEMVSPDKDTGLTENWVCTASPGCPVHQVREPSHQWSYFTHSEDVMRLIESLNKFGIRESELRKSIMRDEKWLKEVIEKSPLQILNSEEYGRKPSVPITSKTRHGNCPPDSSADTVLELELREHILNIEKRISSHCMGTLDVKDVEAWIEAIEKGGYDMQCDKLEWGFSTDLEENVLQNSVESNQSPDKSVNNVSSPNVSDLETAASMSTKSHKRSRESVSSCVLEEKNGESRSSSSLESNFMSWDKRKNNITISTNLDVQSKRQTIENLASAILQLSQAVDVVYLKSPLADEETDDEKIIQLKRWEICLMNSTSFCQLFLHLFLLQSSVAWTKSVVFTRCAICRRRGDGEKMLLCDDCNKGHHMYCLKPKLTKVPEGDWYCMKCKPVHLNDTQVRKRRSTRSVGGTKEYEKRPSKSRKIVHNDVCNACGLGYNLILCSACPLAYHTVCLSPPSKEVLEGTWMCSECKPGYAAEEKENKTSRSRRSSRNLVFSQAPVQDLLSDMMDHKDAWPFLRPVRKAEAPGYHIIIKKPMDLGTMKSKLNSSQYKNMSQFVADALLVFENCRMYNDKDSEVYKSGSRLSQFFKKRCAVLGVDLQD